MKRTLLLLGLAVGTLAENTVRLLRESDAAAFSEAFHIDRADWRIFRMPDDHIIAELTTTIRPVSPATQVTARFVEPRAIDGPKFDVMDVTDCLSDNAPDYACTQHWYMRSSGTVARNGETVTGKIASMAETDESPEHLFTLHHGYSVQFDAVADEAQSLLTVESLPYITAVAKTAGSTIEGQRMCVTMRHSQPIVPSRAMLCASASGDHSAEDSCDASDNIITLFDADRPDYDAGSDVDVQKPAPGASDNVQICYNDVKLGPYNQLVQVEYYEAGSVRRSITVAPQGGYFGHGYNSSCRIGWFWEPEYGRCHILNHISWFWPICGVLALVVCLLGLGCVALGGAHYGDHQEYHPAVIPNGPRQASQQAQHGGRVVIFNTAKAKNTRNYDDADRFYYYDDDRDYDINYYRR